MSDKTYKITFSMSDGTKKEVSFTAPQGETGAAGADGYTPAKGTDFFTEADKAEMVSDLVAKLSLGIASDGLIYIFVDGTPIGTGIPQGQSGDVFGYVDENNTIVLNGNLADGTYTLKYEMDNGEIVNIGNMVLDSNVYYTITKNLTQCSINNSATQIVEGESYSATITANDGYELKSVSVTMGGTDVTVTDGVIDIASVTGNIVITAVAEEAVVTPNYTNLLPLAVDASGNAYVGTNGEKGYKAGYRIRSSTAVEEAKDGAYVTGFIPVNDIYDVIRIKNITISSANSVNNIVFYDSNKTKLYGQAGDAGVLFQDGATQSEDGVYSVIAKTWLSATTGSDISFFRFSCGGITDETIVTVNEEIA